MDGQQTAPCKRWTSLRRSFPRRCRRHPGAAGPGMHARRMQNAGRVAPDEDVVTASELRAARVKFRKLERRIGRPASRLEIL